LFFIIYAPCFVATPLGQQRLRIRNDARQKRCTKDEVPVEGVRKSIPSENYRIATKQFFAPGAPPAMISGANGGK
jgi:hypothetical protein